MACQQWHVLHSCHFTPQKRDCVSYSQPPKKNFKLSFFLMEYLWTSFTHRLKLWEGRLEWSNQDPVKLALQMIPLTLWSVTVECHCGVSLWSVGGVEMVLANEPQYPWHWAFLNSGKVPENLKYKRSQVTSFSFYSFFLFEITALLRYVTYHEIHFLDHTIQWF
jgi:hypothetical protein